MLRILICGFCAVPGPDRTGVQMNHVIRALARRHAVDVLVARAGDQAYVERAGSTRFLRVPIPDAGNEERVAAFRRALRRQLEGAEYDVVHFRDGWTGVVALELRERLRYAAVFDMARSPMADPAGLDPDTAATLAADEARCLREADLVLAPTVPAQRFASELSAPERVHLVPPGVDVDLFDWDDPPPAGPPVVLYLGALAPGRGVRVLVRAILDVLESVDVKLVLAGPTVPGFRNGLDRAVRELGIDSHLEVPGAVAHADVPDLIARAAICVAPGAVELTPAPTALYPTKILEYMACRRPVIAPRRGTVSMVVEDGRNGALFTPGDPGDLAAKILRLLENYELRERIAEAGYEDVRRVHSASNCRRAVRHAYAWLAHAEAFRDRFERERETDDAYLPRPYAALQTAEVTTIDGDGTEDRAPAAALAGDFDTRMETHPGEITTVEPLAFDEQMPAGGAEAEVAAAGWQTHDDEWGVAESRTHPTEIASLAAADEDGDGTAVELDRPLFTPPIETRFVAGELEVGGGGASAQAGAGPAAAEDAAEDEAEDKTDTGADAGVDPRADAAADAAPEPAEADQPDADPPAGADSGAGDQGRRSESRLRGRLGAGNAFTALGRLLGSAVAEPWRRGRGSRPGGRSGDEDEGDAGDS